jgi:hypothetical protein
LVKGFLFPLTPLSKISWPCLNCFPSM